MLGYVSERRLLSLLDGIKEGELYQEQLRQRLCSMAGFAPYSVFMRLDRDANERISAYEILNFMRENREYTVSESDCLNIVRYFDTNNDSRLSFQE